MFPPFWRAGDDMMMLSAGAQGVIVQRMTMFAMGGSKMRAEAQRLVIEKVLAAGEAAMRMAAEASRGAVVNDYRRKVRAKWRRLGR